jgi:hypothetical protein
VQQVAPGKTNIGHAPQYELRDDLRIEQHGLDAEVLYAGGGNFVVLFSDNDKAKKFTSHLSRHVLLEASGLQLVITPPLQIEWDRDVLCHKLDEAMRMLAVQKRKRTWSAPLAGLGVMAMCNATGLPATGVTRSIGGEPGYLASDEIQAKVEVATPHGGASSLADQRLQAFLKLPDYRFPADFEDIGATAGEYSHIAIVHADGNGMGQCIQEICRAFTKVEQNRAYVLALRSFSVNVQRAAQSALQVALDRLTGQIIDEDGSKVIKYKLNPKTSIQIKLAKDKAGRYYLPFRPIVFGGDDVTFVCDGRLGLSLATIYLHEFERYTHGLGKDDGKLTACAGIAIVKSHYPFARAYQLAADLTTSAKSYRTKQTIAGSCLDWHFALSGLGGSIAEIRKREYQTRPGSLTLRPVTLDDNPRDIHRAWPVVAQGIAAFQGEGWAERRNKIKALRDALREGPEAVGHFRVAFNSGNPLPAVLHGMQDWELRGWHGLYCGYFDAIESADWFMPLEGRSK